MRAVENCRGELDGRQGDRAWTNATATLQYRGDAHATRGAHRHETAAAAGLREQLRERADKPCARRREHSMKSRQVYRGGGRPWR